MYAGRVVPGQTFDHTRRYQNDIVVYSENELRSAMGNLSRGTRVVIANEIFITKPIYVKIKYRSGTPDLQFKDIVISGFGGGSLIPKAGLVKRSFDLFILSPIPASKSEVAVSFEGIFVKGFKTAISRSTNFGGPAWAIDITGCKFIDCENIVDGSYWYFEFCDNYVSGASVVFNNFSTSRMTMSANQLFAYDLSMKCSRASITGNVMEGGIMTMSMEQSCFSGNYVKCDNVQLYPYNTAVPGQLSASTISGNKFTQSSFTGVFNIADGSEWVIDGNHVDGELQIGANAAKMIVSDNYFGRNSLPLSGAEGSIFRDNYGSSASKSINASGRISQAGELIGQTIIDGVSTSFSCETSSTTYKQLNDDLDATKKASISFYVPANRKIVIRLNAELRDYDTYQALFYIRLTDVDDATTPASFAAFVNDEHFASYSEQLFPIYTFEWFIDGTDPNINWTAGDVKTFWFQIKVQDAAETVSVKAGASYIPMNIGAVAVSDDLNFVDMG
jgi:hypothetical protein